MRRKICFAYYFRGDSIDFESGTTRRIEMYCECAFFDAPHKLWNQRNATRTTRNTTKHFVAKAFWTDVRCVVGNIPVADVLRCQQVVVDSAFDFSGKPRICSESEQSPIELDPCNIHA